MHRTAFLAALALAFCSTLLAGDPSRPAFEGCKWQKFSDAALGLDAWVQHCDFKGRKVDFVRQGSSLAQRYSDGGKPEPVIDVFELKPNETPEQGMRRIFAAHTGAKLATRCVLALTKDELMKQRAGAKRWNFVPDAKYQKELDAKHDPDDGIPDPPCGDYGVTYDSVEYWESQPGAQRVIYVRAGQDDPLFDENTLKIK